MNFVSGVLMEQCYEQRFTPWCRCVILGIPLLFWTVPLICFDCSMLARLTCMMISSLNIHIAACQRIFSETDHLVATICFQPLEYRLLSWTWSYRLLSIMFANIGFCHGLYVMECCIVETIKWWCLPLVALVLNSCICSSTLLHTWHRGIGQPSWIMRDYSTSNNTSSPEKEKKGLNSAEEN